MVTERASKRPRVASIRASLPRSCKNRQPRSASHATAAITPAITTPSTTTSRRRSTHAQPFRFMHLPSEIRGLIYQCLFESTRVVYDFQDPANMICKYNYPGLDNSKRSTMHCNAILRVSKQCHQEAINIYYANVQTVFVGVVRRSLSPAIDLLHQACARLTRLSLPDLVSYDTRVWPQFPKLEQLTVSRLATLRSRFVCSGEPDQFLATATLPTSANFEPQHNPHLDVIAEMRSFIPDGVTILIEHKYEVSFFYSKEITRQCKAPYAIETWDRILLENTTLGTVTVNDPVRSATDKSYREPDLRNFVVVHQLVLLDDST